MILFGLLLTFTITLVTTHYLSQSTDQFSILDRPNSRSLHEKPISRIGGLALLTGGFLGYLLISLLSYSSVNFHWLVLLGGFLPLTVISFFDDWGSVRAKCRFFIHIWAGLSFLFGNYTFSLLQLPGYALALPLWISIPLTLLFVVWMINLYNFMDGMDGFAGGMAVIGFSALAWIGRADATFLNLCLIVVAASAGFLVYNFPPAKIFMGDTGSTALGFLAAACSLWGSEAGLFPLWVALLVFSPFIADATVTLLRRLLRGERIWEAHRTHYYQRLVLLGWGHRRTVLAEYILMLACAGSAAWAVYLSPLGQMILSVVWIFIYVLLMLGVGWLERRRATVSAL